MAYQCLLYKVKWLIDQGLNIRFKVLHVLLEPDPGNPIWDMTQEWEVFYPILPRGKELAERMHGYFSYVNEIVVEDARSVYGVDDSTSEDAGSRKRKRLADLIHREVLTFVLLVRYSNHTGCYRLSLENEGFLADGYSCNFPSYPYGSTDEMPACVLSNGDRMIRAKN